MQESGGSALSADIIIINWQARKGHERLPWREIQSKLKKQVILQLIRIHCSLMMTL